MACAVFLVGGCSPQIANRDSRGETIVCFGNSITAGYGVSAAESYPVLLAQKVNFKVINSGRSGDTSLEGLQRIEQDVFAYNPRIVIVEFGGNDYLHQIPRAETFKNIDQMVEMIQSRGAMVVLATVKIGFFVDAYAQGFKEIAKKRKALLILDVMQNILDNPQLKYDQIHPNNKGYQLIFERIYKAIKPLVKE